MQACVYSRNLSFLENTCGSPVWVAPALRAAYTCHVPHLTIVLFLIFLHSPQLSLLRLVFGRFLSCLSFYNTLVLRSFLIRHEVACGKGGWAGIGSFAKLRPLLCNDRLDPRHGMFPQLLQNIFVAKAHDR